jgi:hypothetical protein
MSDYNYRKDVSTTTNDRTRAIMSSHSTSQAESGPSIGTRAYGFTSLGQDVTGDTVWDTSTHNTVVPAPPIKLTPPSSPSRIPEATTTIEIPPSDWAQPGLPDSVAGESLDVPTKRELQQRDELQPDSPVRRSSLAFPPPIYGSGRFAWDASPDDPYPTAGSREGNGASRADDRSVALAPIRSHDWREIDRKGEGGNALLTLPPPPPFHLDVENLWVGVPDCKKAPS